MIPTPIAIILAGLMLVGTASASPSAPTVAMDCTFVVAEIPIITTDVIIYVVMYEPAVGPSDLTPPSITLPEVCTPYAEVWEEVNYLQGLQREETLTPTGYIPADACVALC